MNDKPLEGNTAAGGEPNANSTSSQPQGQPLEATLAETIATLQKKLEAQDGEIRALKSGKDKAVDRALKTQEETLAKLAKYLDVDESKVREAQRQSVLDDLISERLGGTPSAQPIQGRVGAQDDPAGSRTVDNFSVADAIAEVEAYQLPPNDPNFIDLLRKGVTKDKVRDYILERKKPNPPASPAGVTQAPAVSPARGEKSEAQLETDFQKEAAQIVQNTSGDARIRALAALKTKYRGMGLQKN